MFVERKLPNYSNKKLSCCYLIPKKNEEKQLTLSRHTLNTIKDCHVAWTISSLVHKAWVETILVALKFTSFVPYVHLSQITWLRMFEFLISYVVTSNSLILFVFVQSLRWCRQFWIQRTKLSLESSLWLSMQSFWQQNLRLHCLGSWLHFFVL